ncbi:unnamed protein product [Rotaria sp. Silwood2]|nr:unnamed protein product [Rotaria sp. Silwood2]CAF2722523.1 unnamed protein product [Rotaria sp. Silwood2]CAF3102806.1 unnamed protein product [Rotaria sp. Silwood2]CAF4119242.1 unnamed protein product [Rotaria sp. Silwood2]CAF4314437.1 unnamed protein product [Rotaria sp. Silwood2]
MSTGQNKKCGKCEKIVYPAEEIKCLDKFWHKGCLKCTACGMTLNVKNAKGYDRMPYCNAHYPQPKPTVVADNPEMQRIRLLTDIQSNAKYHEDFNKSKGKFTVVADDPALIRAKEQQRMVSQAEYTGKRKDSTSQMLAQDNSQQPSGNNTNNRGLKTSESAVGRVADYDPMNDNRGSLARGYEPTAKPIHSTTYDVNQKNIAAQLNSKFDNNNSSGHGNRSSHNQYENEQEISSNNIHHDDQHKQHSPDDTGSTQMKVRALYSYNAAESDEISFNEGDILVQCENIDAGWMLGRNPKTGQQGLLPSNYVEIID